MKTKAILQGLGFLRETQVEADGANKKYGPNHEYGIYINRTGLDVYLKRIFPLESFVHDQYALEEDKRLRPDYRSKNLKLLVEFDGINHYTTYDVIKRDENKTVRYIAAGYRVVRIPFFIQLTRKAVKKLFHGLVDEAEVDRLELFPDNVSGLPGFCNGVVPSLGKGCAPSDFCIDGILRAAKEFLQFEDQYRASIGWLKNKCEGSRWEILDHLYKVFSQMTDTEIREFIANGMNSIDPFGSMNRYVGHINTSLISKQNTKERMQ